MVSGRSVLKEDEGGRGGMMDIDILGRFQQEIQRPITTTYSPTDDLRKAALAENIMLQQDEKCSDDTVVVTFDFLCPNCGKRHWAREIDSVTSLFSTVGWSLRCGWTAVRMPWAQTPKRDSESIYGHKK
jgi:hypothetical protein